MYSPFSANLECYDTFEESSLAIKHVYDSSETIYQNFFVPKLVESCRTAMKLCFSTEEHTE